MFTFWKLYCIIRENKSAAVKNQNERRQNGKRLKIKAEFYAAHYFDFVGFIYLYASLF